MYIVHCDLSHPALECHIYNEILNKRKRWKIQPLAWER